MTYLKQLDLWCKGQSVHRGHRDDPESECCPDFSCCNNKVNTPMDVRERFRQAVIQDDEKTIMEMLGMFLGTAIATISDKKVHIAGLEPESQQQ